LTSLDASFCRSRCFLVVFFFAVPFISYDWHLWCLHSANSRMAACLQPLHPAHWLDHWFWCLALLLALMDYFLWGDFHIWLCLICHTLFWWIWSQCSTLVCNWRYLWFSLHIFTDYM
jgi:hypothetical protein